MRVLIISDDRERRENLSMLVGSLGYDVISAKCVTFREDRHVDVVILSSTQGLLEALSISRRRRQVPHLVDPIALDAAVAALRQGAVDIISSPDAETLRLKLIRAVAAPPSLPLPGPPSVGLTSGLEKLIGPSMTELARRLERIAQSSAPVHIHGESGTGKELVAEAIHNLSQRPGPLVRVNCGAIPESLIESELFGHEKGAFTGAHARRIGRFEQADTGTIFLDEVAELPLAAQVKLLRVLQERVVERVGGAGAVALDIRVISATNKNLEALKGDTFREDLYYRLKVLSLDIPPLRDRPDDILPLATHFLRGRAELTSDAGTLLASYNFPGNVRELENVIEQALVSSTSFAIQVADLPLAVATSPQLPEPPASLRDVVRAYERELILRALDASTGRAEAARRLGLKPTELLFKLHEHNL